MRVSERRSPTFPWRLAAGRACGVGGGGFAEGGGVHLFLTTSQVPALIWELFISCQKTAFPPATAGRGAVGVVVGGVSARGRGREEKGGGGREAGGGRGVWLQKMSPGGSVQRALGLNHKALACLGRNQRQARRRAEGRGERERERE